MYDSIREVLAWSSLILLGGGILLIPFAPLTAIACFAGAYVAADMVY